MDEILEQIALMQRLGLIDTTHSNAVGIKAKSSTRHPTISEQFLTGETALIKTAKGGLDAAEATGKLPGDLKVAYSLIKSLDAVNAANIKAPIHDPKNSNENIIIAYIKRLKAASDFLKAKDMLDGNVGEFFEHIKAIDATATIYDNVHKMISNHTKGNPNAWFSDAKAVIKILRASGAFAEAAGVEFTGTLAQLYRATKIIDGVGTFGDGILGMFGQSAIAEGGGAVLTEFGAGAAIASGAEVAAMSAVGLGGLGLVGYFTYAALTGKAQKETEAEAVKRMQLTLKSPTAF